FKPGKSGKPGKRTPAEKSAAMIETGVEARLFHGLDPDELATILEAAKERRFPAKTVIFDQSHPAEEMLLLTHGRARHFLITHGGQRILFRWLVPGDVAGARALLLEPTGYAVGAEALKDSRFLFWDRSTIHHLTNRYPRLLRNVLFIAD